MKFMLPIAAKISPVARLVCSPNELLLLVNGSFGSQPKIFLPGLNVSHAMGSVIVALSNWAPVKRKPSSTAIGVPLLSGTKLRSGVISIFHTQLPACTPPGTAVKVGAEKAEDTIAQK